MARDVLGEQFEVREIPLRPDDEGEVVATLVTRPAGHPTTRAVLYVHGFADYFFHPHVAQEWTERGFDFYAIDLRKYGRSLRPWQTPNYVTSLHAYDEELAEAVRIIREEDGHDVLVVMAHSMGGLVTALWANRLRGTGAVQAVVMNSPWLDLAGSWVMKTLTTRAVDVLGRLLPKTKVGALKEHYGHALHLSAKGEWDYNLEWKPFDAFPVLAGWIRAVRRGHAELARGLDVDVPVLVATSHASGSGDTWSDAIVTTDVVLDVVDMWRMAPRIGRDVTVVRIPGGMHDLALSPLPARQRFFDETFAWVESRLVTTQR